MPARQRWALDKWEMSSKINSKYRMAENG